MCLGVDVPVFSAKLDTDLVQYLLYHCLAFSVAGSLLLLFNQIGSVKVVTWISLTNYMDLSRLKHGFIKVVLNAE